jgi:hypothetical protein
MENGDKFFAKVTSVLQSIGPGRFTITAAGPVTGGTGKLAGTQGIIRVTGTVGPPKAGFNEAQYEIDYRIEK